jgi:hypothetical protein
MVIALRRLAALLLLAGSAYAQAANLIKNPSAEEGADGWEISGAAIVEKTIDGNPHFVIRNHGTFSQDVRLPEKSTGKFALLIGRLEADKRTGLPYLYGYVLASANSKSGLIRDFLQSKTMFYSGATEKEWAVSWGIFKIPSGASSIRLLMMQSGPGALEDGATARFDDLGLYIFATQQEANTFVETYRKQNR